MCRDAGRRQATNPFQVGRVRGDSLLDPTQWSGRVQRRLGLEITFQQSHRSGETLVIQSVRRSERSQSRTGEPGQAADALLLQNALESTSGTKVLSHAV